MIDSELKYCPDCRDEYRAEMSTCASCNTELVWGDVLRAAVGEPAGQVSSAAPEITENDKLFTLQAGSLLEMKNVKRILRSHCIPAILLKDEKNCRSGCCGPEIQLQIRLQDQEPASVVLRNEFAESTVLHSYDQSTADAIFDPDAALTICPACGQQFCPDGATCPECGLAFL